jgi:two-component system chemotaxis response regulator CheY
MVLFKTDLGEFCAGVNLNDSPEDMNEKPYRFMIVDDSKVMRRVLKNTLQEADIGACQIYEAADGQFALDELERIGFDVDAVFCDINMPNMSGMTFLDSMAERGRLQSCPVIIVTGDASEGLGDRLLARGARDWVCKPFTPEAVREALRDILGVT